MYDCDTICTINDKYFKFPSLKENKGEERGFII